MKPIGAFVDSAASTARRRRPLRHGLPAAFAVLLAAASVCHAAPITTQGTWWGTDGTDGTLRARDMAGNAVALDSASAAFFHDTTLNITWLADMDANGPMNWDTAVQWAASLSTGGFSDWRLPTIIDSSAPGCDLDFGGGTDCGHNVQTQVDGAYSEWAHLFYVTLGNLGYCAPGDSVCASGQAGWGLANTAYFQDMRPDGYWSGTEYAPHPALAWNFRLVEGYQGGFDKGHGLFAVAVRSGDVLRETVTVPEPQSLALALTALAGLGLGLRGRAARAAT